MDVARERTEGESQGPKRIRRVSVVASSSAPPGSAITSATTTQDVQSAAPVEKPPYPPPAAVATQEGPHGIRYDFNNGCRVTIPEGEKAWRVRLSDLDTGNILFETTMKGGAINSAKRFYVRFRLEVWSGETLPFTHDHEALKPELFYATYSIGLFFDDKEFVFQPTDFRYVGLHRTAGYILGVDPQEVPPRITVAEGGRPIAEPYVCIAAQSTTQSKYWNNPEGWRAIVQFLKEAGYRVICIDQKATHGTGIIWNHIPYGAEDETGDRTLMERARWLKHAEFFIGLSSGLSWLAWAARCPVVMISGFTHPLNEFETPYRIFNVHTCNSCWNDPQIRFDHKDFLWCPRHKDTPRQFECTRLITVEHVKNVIRKIPAFAKRTGASAG